MRVFFCCTSFCIKIFFNFEVNGTQIYSTTMNDLNHIRDIYRIQTKVKTCFVLNDVDDSKKSLANIKSPLDRIIESQYAEKQHINTNKDK